MTLSDGSSFFILKEVQVAEMVYPGSEVSPEERLRLERLSKARAATHSAFGLLARAAHSRSGLRLKLLQRGYDDEAALAALGRAEEMGYLDDARFAEQWISLRLEHHPEGRAALVAGLRERGVPRETAEAAVKRAVTDEVEEDALVRAVRRAGRGASRPQGGAEKSPKAVAATRLVARMRALGFPDRLIRRHLPLSGGSPD